MLWNLIHFWPMLPLHVTSSPPEVFLGKGVLKYAAKLQESTHAEVWFIEITFRHGCSPVNLLHIFRTSFLKNTPGDLLLIWQPVNAFTLCNELISFCLILFGSILFGLRGKQILVTILFFRCCKNETDQELFIF